MLAQSFQVQFPILPHFSFCVEQIAQHQKHRAQRTIYIDFSGSKAHACFQNSSLHLLILQKRNYSTEVSEPPVSQLHRDDTSLESWIIPETATSLCPREVQQLWCPSVNRNSLRNTSTLTQLYHFPPFQLVPRSPRQFCLTRVHESITT